MAVARMRATTGSSHAGLAVAIDRWRGIDDGTAGDHAVGGMHVLCDAKDLAVVRQIQGDCSGREDPDATSRLRRRQWALHCSSDGAIDYIDFIKSAG